MFSVLIGNADMHLKNWSLLYPDRRTPVLSPAYDFVATLPYIPERQARPEFRRQPQPCPKSRQTRCGALPTRRGFPQARSGRLQSRRRSATVAAWKELEQADLLPKDMRASIDKQILAVAASLK